MKKTLLTLSVLSVVATSVYAEGPQNGSNDPLETAISKNSPRTLKALDTTYRNNNLTLSAAQKIKLIELAQQQVDAKKTATLAPLYKDWKSWGHFILNAGQSLYGIAGMYKTLFPSEDNKPRGWKALNDTNNIFYFTASSIMLVGGVMMLRDLLKKSESAEDKQALKNAQKSLKILEQFPTAA
jgi:hypothetical protein